MALRAGLDLRAPLRSTNERGAAFVPDALDDAFLRTLWLEIRAGPLRRFRESFGLVRQQIEGYDVRDPMDGFPRVAELKDALAALVRTHGRGVRGLASWSPNEAGIALYRRGSIGITPHLDGKRYRRLVAVVTVQGAAPFTWCRDRGGEPIEVWDTGPGSLVLMRAPGLGGRRDGRPFHAAAGPRHGLRCSLAFRMDASAREAGGASGGSTLRPSSGTRRAAATRSPTAGRP